MYSVLPSMISDNIENICKVLTMGETHPSHGAIRLLVIGFLFGRGGRGGERGFGRLSNAA